MSQPGRTADFLLRHLQVSQPIGQMPPGSDAHVRVTGREGEVTIFGNGETVTVVAGHGDHFRVARVSPEDALSLGWFLIWRWWVRGTWCGLKLGLWRWALGAALDAELEAKHDKQTKAQGLGQRG